MILRFGILCEDIANRWRWCLCLLLSLCLSISLFPSFRQNPFLFLPMFDWWLAISFPNKRLIFGVIVVLILHKIPEILWLSVMQVQFICFLMFTIFWFVCYAQCLCVGRNMSLLSASKKTENYLKKLITGQHHVMNQRKNYMKSHRWRWTSIFPNEIEKKTKNKKQKRTFMRQTTTKTMSLL